MPVTDRQYLAVLVDITKLCWTEVRLFKSFCYKGLQDCGTVLANNGSLSHEAEKCEDDWQG